MNQRFLILLSVASLAAVAFLLTTSIPLGIPDEWQWSRHANFLNPGAALDRFILPVIAAGLLITVAALAQPRDQQNPAAKAIGAYSLLMAVGWTWLYCVQQAAPAFHREIKPYWVVYAPSSSGYFFEAAFKMPSSSEFLTNYEDRMSEGEVLHVGTHPPGLFLLSKACLKACESSPRLVSFLSSVNSTQSRETFQQLETEARLAHPLNDQQLAALQLLSMLSQLTIMLTIIPLTILARMMFSKTIAWWICCLWPTLPCLAVFFPKSDVLFPFTTTMTLALAALALQGHRRVLCAAAAGLILWFGLMLSLAHIPITAVLFFLVIIRAVSSKGASAKSDVITGLIVIASIAICCTTFSIATNCNIANVWQWNLSNHAGFYEQFPRTWYKWLLVNPIELLLSLAVPVGFLGLIGLNQTFKQTNDASDNQPASQFSRHMVWAMALVMLLLWLSGKNQGEAARLWCFMTPWVLLTAGYTLAKLNEKQFRWLLSVQLIAATITVGIVNGFSF